MVQPEPGLLRWVTKCVDPGAAVVSVTGLRRGESPWLVGLSDSDIDEVVVRVGDESSVALLATEAAALEAIAASDVPGPRLLGVAMGGPGTPDVFALVMTRVPGSSRSTVEPSTARLRALGAAVAMVHAAPVPTSPHLPVRQRPIEPVDFDAVRRCEPARSLLVEAEVVLRRIPMPDHTPVLVHGDFWYGNTMWDHDQLTGIIDWECAGIGHPGIDLGMQRCDAALVVGLSGAHAVLAGYESAIGRPAADVAYWDVAAALTTPPTMGSFVQIYAGQGRTDLDPPTLLARRDTFLAAALDSISGAGEGSRAPCR
jgi:aminoglycoside phosphotransferase (APT) family kinase protein